MKLYETMAYNENMSWCRPYISDRVSYTLCEGYITCVRIDGEDYTAPVGGRQVSDDVLAKAARIAVEDYDLYNGYSDEDLIMLTSVCKECGCSSCPWKCDCEVVNVDSEEGLV